MTKRDKNRKAELHKISTAELQSDTYGRNEAFGAAPRDVVSQFV